MVADRMANLTWGGDRSKRSKDLLNVTQAAAAERMNVSVIAGSQGKPTAGISRRADASYTGHPQSPPAASLGPKPLGVFQLAVEAR
jgi:hypothetical protein